MADELFGGNVFGGFNHPQEETHEPAFVPPVIDHEEEPATEAVEEQAHETAEEKPAPKPAKKPNRKPNRPSNELNANVVKTVLALSEKVSSLSDSDRELVGSLLGVKNASDDVRLIIALADSETVKTARETLKDLKDLAKLDDMQFAVKLSMKDHAYRKSLWELETSLYPDYAGEKFPPNDPLAEVTLLRKVQKENPGFGERVDGVESVLD